MVVPLFGGEGTLSPGGVVTLESGCGDCVALLSGADVVPFDAPGS